MGAYNNILCRFVKLADTQNNLNYNSHISGDAVTKICDGECITHTFLHLVLHVLQ